MMATLTFKTMKFGQPIYLRELISIYEPVRTLHSCSQHVLYLNRTTTVVDIHLFKHSSTTVWNSLPAHVHNFNSIESLNVILKLTCLNQPLQSIRSVMSPHLGILLVTYGA